MSKKGFTLVELLAVIIVIAIIAAIITPIIVNTIETSKKETAKLNVVGYIDSVKKTIVENMEEDDVEKIITDDIYEISELKEKGVKVKGKKPSGGWVQIENGQIIGYSIKIGDYVGSTKDKNIKSPEIVKNGEILSKPESTVKKYDVGAVIKYNPVTNEKCSNPVSTTGTKTGCMKWYVIKDNGSSVDVILDHNTTIAVAWNSSIKNNEMKEIATQLTTDTTEWENGINPRIITANEIANITNTTTFDDRYPNEGFYFDGTGDKKQTQVSDKKGENEFAWLFDYTNECGRWGGCNIEDSSTYGYWTSTPVSAYTYDAWCISNGGSLQKAIVSTKSLYGLRPVITIQKSVIK